MLTDSQFTLRRDTTREGIQDLFKWDQQVVSELAALRNFVKKKLLLHLRSVCYKEMDQDSVHMVVASKVPMIKPVIENGNAPPITKVVKGVETTIAPTTAEEKTQRRRAHSTNEAVNTAHGATIASTQATDVNSTTIDNLSDAVICAFFASQPNSLQLDNEDLQQIHPEFRVSRSKILVYKKNESVFEEDIKVLKRKIHLREVAITELRRKLELAQKQKDEIQLKVENFENSSKSLSKLIECQIVDNLEEFVNEPIVSEPTVKKPVVETSEAKASADKPKAVRKNLGPPLIEGWISDSEDEAESKYNIEKKTVKPSFAKIEFVKSKEQVKSPRKTTVKQGPLTTTKNSNQKVNTVRGNNVNTAKLKAVVNAVKGNHVNAVKASAC
ncbi:hypothetical protein Tco_0455785 [Tanacetum coccineum]